MALREDAETVPGVVRLGGSTTEVLARLGTLRNEALRNFVRRGDALDDDEAFCEGMRYVLNDVRQGIYVLVRAGRPRLVASVANTRYTNTFSDGLRFRSEDGEVVDYARFAARNRTLCRDWIAPQRWWASHGILCTTPADAKFGWGTGMLAEIRAMLEQACARRDLDDVEFVVNRRDVPMVRYDGRHCYAFAGAAPPRHVPRLPVLSLYQGDDWCDLPLVEPSEPAELRSMPWQSKKPWALFRGNCTGAGTTRDTNVRIELAHEGAMHAWRLEGGRTDVRPLVDAAIIGVSRRGKFVEEAVVAFDDRAALPPLGNRIDMSEWGKWKFLIYAEGYSAALRMTSMLSAMSAIYVIDGHSSADELWYFDKFVKVDWFETYRQQELHPPEANIAWIADPEGLRYTLPFLQQHDDVAFALARNARRLFDDVRQTRLDVMAATLATCTDEWRRRLLRQMASRRGLG